MKISKPLGIGLFATALVAAWVLPTLAPSSYTRLGAWLLMAVAVLFAVISLTREGTLREVLVDERGRFGLPNLITLSWFVVLVSAYLATAMWNLSLWSPGSGELPIFIKVQAAIWVLAGIVGADLVVTGMVVNAKRKRDIEERRKGSAEGPPSQPTLYVASEPHSWDLISYDEVGLEAVTDLGAVQKMLFQIAAVLIYAVAIGTLLFVTDARTAISEFPTIPDGFLALLGVSAGVSAINRAVPRVPVTKSQAGRERE